MASANSDIASVMHQVRNNADAIDTAVDLDAWIGNRSIGKPRRREVQSADDLKNDLENQFLTPSPRFNTQWLNRLQKYVFLFSFFLFSLLLFFFSRLIALLHGGNILTSTF